MDYNKIKDVFKEGSTRMKNPFISSFVIAWIFWNWKAISYFLLSKEIILVKLKYVKLNYSNYCDTLWWPLAVCLVYLIFAPFVFFGIEFIHELASKLRKDNVHNVEMGNLGRKKEIEGRKEELQKITSNVSSIIELKGKLDDLTSTLDNEQKKNESLELDAKKLNKKHADLMSSYSSMTKANINFSKPKEEFNAVIHLYHDTGDVEKLRVLLKKNRGFTLHREIAKLLLVSDVEGREAFKVTSDFSGIDNLNKFLDALNSEGYKMSISKLSKLSKPFILAG